MIKDFFGLVDVITGYQPAALISAGHELGLFPKLDRRIPRSADDLAAELDVSPPNLDKLLAALSAIGLLEEHDDGYTATEFTARELTDGTDVGKVVAKEAFFARIWNDLADSVRSGTPLLAPWRERLQTDPATARHFLEALDVLARRTGPPLTDLSLFDPGTRVLDVGGGLGTYARRVASIGVSVTLVDLPTVAQWAKTELEDVDGVSVVAADVLSHPSCGVEAASHDGALVSHLIHDLQPEEAVELLRRVAKALRPGGRVVVNDFAGDRGPGAFGPLFDVMMSVETGASAYPLAELMEMMRQAGFEDISEHDLPDPLTVLSGVKP